MTDEGWKQLLVVVGLLLLLTYFLRQSQSPDLALRPYLHEGLHAFELYDVRLTRDVLLARAGLLPHYDALAQSSRGLSQALETLRQGSQLASRQAAKILGQHVEALDAALQQKLTLIEHFTTDNALMRNSLMYVFHAGEDLRREAAANGYETAVAEVGALSHALLRFMQTPETTIGQEIEGIIDRLPPTLPFQSDLPVLVAHGRLIVDVLPQVDSLLRQIMVDPAMTHVRALREGTLEYYGQVEARAQIFRWLLYFVAVALLG